MLSVYVGPVKDLISQKKITMADYYIKSLTGQRYDRVQTESQELQD